MHRILVTGGLGAVGAPLTRELRRRGHDVWTLDRLHGVDPRHVRGDVGEFRQLQQVFDDVDVDVVYHAAAEFGRRNGEDHYEQVWRTNAVGTKNVLRLQEDRGFRLVCFSSSEVYGDWPGVMAEDVPAERPLRQLNDYAISKWVNELQVMNSMDRFSTETVRVRLFNTYGPGEAYSPYRSVICQFVHHALLGRPYTVYRNHHRTSTYIDDTVRTLANITDAFHPGEVYNISGDQYHDIETVSDLVLAATGADPALAQYADGEPHNTRDKKSDNSRAVRDLDHRATVGLEEGISRTVEWQQAIYC